MIKKLLLVAIGALLLVYLIPSVNLPWSLIDDGQRIQINQQMGESLSKGNFADFIHIPIDKKDSRLRPVYWIYHYINQSVFGLRANWHHVARNTLLIFFIASLYSVIKKTSNTFIALLTVFLALLFPTNLENWWRLGPQEPLLVSFAIFSLWFLIVKRKLFPALIFSLLFFFTKESSVFVMPALAAGFLFNKQKKLDNLYKKYLFINLGIGLFVAILMFLIKKGSGYSSYFETSFQTMWDTFLKYIVLLGSYGFKYVIILALAYFSHQTIVKKKLSKSILLATLLAVSALAIQLPWPVPLGRYLLPLSIPLSFIIATAIEGVFKRDFISKLKIPIKIFAIFALFSLSFYSSLVMLSFAGDYYVRERSNQEFISQLATKLEPESRLFINLTDELNAWEWFDEVQINLELFHQKTPQTFYARLLQEEEYQLEKKDVLVSWNQFQDLTDVEIDLLTEGLVSQSVLGYYNRPSGGIKTLMSDLLKHPKEFLSFKSSYWTTKSYIWNIYSHE